MSASAELLYQRRSTPPKKDRSSAVEAVRVGYAESLLGERRNQFGARQPTIHVRGWPSSSVVGNNFNDISGLPDDLARAEQRVSVRVDTRQYDKAMTVVEGFDTSTTDLSDLTSTLKSRLAVGGTVTDGRIELQGDHSDRLPEISGTRDSKSRPDFGPYAFGIGRSVGGTVGTRRTPGDTSSESADV